MVLGRWWRMLVAGVVVAGVSACAGNGDEASVPLPVAAEDEFAGGGPRSLGGHLDVDGERCWTLDGEVIAFAPGSSIVDDGRAVVTPGGTPVGAGSQVEVSGRLVTPERWPGGAEGRWARHVEECRPGAFFMLLADTVALDPFDPQNVDDEALVALVADARFESTGGCGFAYTAANDDGTVGIIVSVPFNDYEPGSGELPDSRFEISVRVGSRLFDQWCTDVIEPFTEPVVAARWAVVGGRFDHQPPPRGASEVARFVLEDAVVETPLGDVALGTIVMENNCYDCIPG
jgi:hypothetical protein